MSLFPYPTVKPYKVGQEFACEKVSGYKCMGESLARMRYIFGTKPSSPTFSQILSHRHG